MNIVTAKEMYEIDRIAMEEKGLHGIVLMESAGRAIAEKVKTYASKQDLILVLVGSGSNGGDGFVVARTLSNQGYQVEVVQLVADDKIKGDALYHKKVYEQYGDRIKPFTAPSVFTDISKASIIVDAMLGIGVKGRLRPPFKEVVHAVNHAPGLIIAVDIPSGVPAERNSDFDVAIKADYTYVVEMPKLSTFIPAYRQFYGEWSIVSIGLPLDATPQGLIRRTWEADDVQTTLPKRERSAHKGSHGRGLIIGGSSLMPGSITMTAKAALRSGVGLLTVGTVSSVVPSIAAQCSETTFMRLADEDGWITNDQEIDIDSYDAIAIGIGMGRGTDTSDYTKKLLRQAELPVIVDADGLYHLKGDLGMLQKRTSPTILTPHPGEMAMLLECSIATILENPFDVAREFAEKYQVYLVLKGANTIVTDPSGNQWVNTTGNPGLAKGGSGDVLSGIILAMVLQPQSISVALANSCYFLGKSADLLVEERHSTYDLIATDVIEGISSVFRTFD
ncbi:bifunctional NAD(P)H-hydrate repair enzyme Nnr [Paraliobacillus quinghaiensis]|uniref:Bifunctional NAD(P)H-hydrate repair enzyme n=1 Tax=Paraliobacillus quinghaiensis TaxID=470815 RepID=A0A917TR92_9BACI|nr:NAD(P)H-hydrate dehydratase [Paraliobacillus quinghaiensis]GGM34325.1 bifunctional NAD(P)H-hydrate repair enzyme Nnr [Paraliobacillus quinghaiensis]